MCVHTPGNALARLTLQCDIRQESDIKAIVATIIQKYKRIDIMMHASGTHLPCYPPLTP